MVLFFRKQNSHESARKKFTLISTFHHLILSLISFHCWFVWNRKYLKKKLCVCYHFNETSFFLHPFWSILLKNVNKIWWELQHNQCFIIIPRLLALNLHCRNGKIPNLTEIHIFDFVITFLPLSTVCFRKKNREFFFYSFENSN